MRYYVWITTLFEGWHRWAEAPDDVAFLRDYHRHLFHVELGVRVTKSNREVEFFQLKRKVDAYLQEHFAGQRFGASCEMIAEQLLRAMGADYCKVSEDGENGATVWMD